MIEEDACESQLEQVPAMIDEVRGKIVVTEGIASPKDMRGYARSQLVLGQSRRS